MRGRVGETVRRISSFREPFDILPLVMTVHSEGKCEIQISLSRIGDNFWNKYRQRKYCIYLTDVNYVVSLDHRYIVTI